MKWISHGNIGIAVALGLLLAACGGQNRLGFFEGSDDVGDPSLGGEAVFASGDGVYRVTGGGENMWGSRDAFHYLWRKASGDLALTTDVDWVGEGTVPHRKAGWVVRADLTPGGPYADAVVHGDGLISLQYRERVDGETKEVSTPIRGPATMRLERTGDLFTLYVAKSGGPFQVVGSVTLDLPDVVYAGLAVCSHDDTVTETANFSNVSYEASPPVDPEQRVVESTLEIINVETGERRTVRQAREHFEAPNWSRDGKTLLYNSGGRLYTIPVAGGEPRLVNTDFADRCNNDHGYSPDGSEIAISHHAANSDGGSLIYILPSGGGAPRLVTPTGPSYWHGWSPDGRTLVYCAERNGEFDVYSIPAAGGRERRLTTETGLDDGPEYSPDGKYIYFNSIRTGQMKIWRMNANGSNPVQITPDDDYGDWFAHPSPDGKTLVFVSFDKSVEGHPPNKNVLLRTMPSDGGEPRVLATLFGGQGTMNVPSWSPEGVEVAFVSYRLVAP